MSAETALLGASPLERLPIELQRHIVGYLVPQGQCLSFVQRPYKWSSRVRWSVTTRPLSVSAHESISTASENADTPKHCWHTYHSLLRVCKSLSAETQAIVYGQNTFSLSTRAPLAHGNLGPFSASGLRNIKNLQLNIRIDVGTSRNPLICHQQFLQRFVEYMTEHRSTSQSALLRRLEVEICTSDGRLIYSRHIPEHKFFTDSNGEKWKYLLEPLTALPPLAEVRFIGIPAWFSTCLSLGILGKGGRVTPLHWASQRMKNNRLGEPRYRSLRPDDAPLLDWGEFAERNGIKMPDQVREWFVKHTKRWPSRANAPGKGSEG